MKKILLPLLLFVLLSLPVVLRAQDNPTMIAIFPLKNLSGEVKYDDLGWKYADSLAAVLGSKPGSGKSFSLVSMDDVRDQMLAQNVDVKSPSYETDVWRVAKLLGATKIVWATYFVKYEKANIEAKVINTKTLMADPTGIAEKIRPPYDDALSTVTLVADKILPAMH
jgi:hypothetical protein